MQRAFGRECAQPVYHVRMRWSHDLSGLRRDDGEGAHLMGTTHDTVDDDGDRALERLISEQAEAGVRRVWYDGRWWFSVVDVIALLTDAPTPRMYWADMKRSIHAEGFVQLLEKIQQLKMRAADGKQRQTDAADTETLLRIIQSVPSPRAEPVKQWLARTGAERLEELENPAVAADSLRLLYRKKGYSDEWIEARLQNIMARDELAAPDAILGARFRAYPTESAFHGVAWTSRGT